MTMTNDGVGPPITEAEICSVMSIEFVLLNDIDPNPLQPVDRDKGKGIIDLASDIRKTRFVAPVTVLRKRTRFTAVDGHRRMAATRYLQIGRIPAIVLDTDKSDRHLFLLLNRSARRMSAAQLFGSWGQERPDKRGEILPILAHQTRKNIEKMIEIFGVTEAALLADGKLSPHIWKFANDAQNIILDKQVEGDHPALKVITRWVIKHAQTNAVNRLRRDPELNRTKARRLRDAIVEDRPLVVRMRRRVTREA